jgi:mannose-6-phosphate isomerase-like protein (cupin superfamily)
MPASSHALAAALAAMPTPGSGEKRFVQPFTHGSMRLGVYAPVGHDPQQPHAQDEIYVVVRGRGTLVHDGGRTPFGAGDALFVAAGERHRFEDFSDDFAAWVVFWGPDGGERG